MEVIRSHFIFYIGQDPGQFVTQSTGRGLKWGKKSTSLASPRGCKCNGLWQYWHW
ncbi:hypothetical protein Goklo_029090 [Gossypium klotzschianum]|uniref:Uncharacterized protein n=1 Tax=Gossypium klotzschianum TaxID=34286 RepID=A0A7J8WA62_9ROSI|nr:hypothetical protein [Gossypium klotzschianum]